MATTQRYPSPTQTQSGGDGPFYNRPHATAQNPPPAHDAQEEADDLQLRADLARSLAPITASQQSPPQENSQHASPHPYDDESDLRAQLAQGTIGLHEGSPADQQDLSAAAKAKDQRQKVSRACDECRRKKVRFHESQHAHVLTRGTTDSVRCNKRNFVRGLLQLS